MRLQAIFAVILGVVLLATVVCVTVLTAQGHEPPKELLGLIPAMVGLFAGWLVPSPVSSPNGEAVRGIAERAVVTQPAPPSAPAVIDVTVDPGEPAEVERA
jgi:hypothetical protein